MPNSEKPELVNDVNEISPDWLSHALACSGMTARVREIKSEPVGTGQLASSYRLIPSYDAAESASLPDSFVLKIASSDKDTRVMGQSSAVYRNEVNFYLDIAPWANVPTAKCYYGDISELGDQFVLILEDLAPATQGNQLTGLSVEEMELAIAAIAGFHASTWQGKDMTAVQRISLEQAQAYSEGIVALMPAFTERYGSKLGAVNLEILQRFASKALAWWLAILQLDTKACVHGDYRADNLMFAKSDRPPAITVVDWQTPTISPPALDLGHLLGTSIAPTIRHQHESNWLKSYHDALLEQGVINYSSESCVNDYRLTLFYPVFVSVFAGMQVIQTDRGDNMFATMCNNACAAIADNNSLSILDALSNS